MMQIFIITYFSSTKLLSATIKAKQTKKELAMNFVDNNRNFVFQLLNLY